MQARKVSRGLGYPCRVARLLLMFFSWSVFDASRCRESSSRWFSERDESRVVKEH